MVEVRTVAANALVSFESLVGLLGFSIIAGIVFAAVSGQGTIALIIALFAAAFFSRVGC